MGAPLAAVVPSWVVSFYFYGVALRAIGSDSLPACALAGGIAGGAISFITCPVEFAKINAQVQKNMSTRSITKELVQRCGGPQILYRGFTSCFLRDFGQNIAYYFCAEALNRKLAGPLGEDFAPFVSGALTGVLHCTVEFPFDSVKTRKQTVVVQQAASQTAGGAAMNGARSALQISDLKESYWDIMRHIARDVSQQKALR